MAGPAAWDESRPRSGPRPRRKTVASEARKAAPGPARGRGPVRTPRAARAPKKKSLFRRVAGGLFWLGLSLGLAGLVAAFGAYHYFSQDLPSIEGLRNYRPPTVTYVFSDDGRVIGEYCHERRFVVPLESIPQMVINAFLAVEDADFYNHKGINPKAILRAAIANFSSGDKTQGGSTITQQVVKSFLLTPEKSYVRKIKEMILAVRIERNLSKEEILYLYLNQIYLGRGAYGVEAAARTYFGKSAGRLSLAEAAQLAGITRSPNRNPVNDPEYARDRQLTAINERMLAAGFITEAEAKAAAAESLHIVGEWPNPNTTIAPYFTEHVRRLMEERVGPDSLYNDGWRIFTTVNIEAQHAADQAVARGVWEYSRRRNYQGAEEHLASDQAIHDFLSQTAKELPEDGLEPFRLYRAVIMEVDGKNSALSLRVGPYLGRIAKKNLNWALKGPISQRFKKGDVVSVRLSDPDNTKKDEPQAAQSAFSQGSLALDLTLERRTDVQSALLSMEPATGNVKAMVGGRDFSESQFNRAVQSQRQPGSSFKPILYAAAMEHGYTPGSILVDAPLVIDDPGSGKRWKPVNSDMKFKGPMTLATALAGSRNLISIKLLDRLGFEALAETARKLGLTEKLPESLTIALGAHGLHMPEIVTAYSVFANMGDRTTPRYITRVEDRYGHLVESFEVERIPALNPGDACAVTWMLRGVVEAGTGGVVKPLGRPVAGKTGTTNDFSDAWFVGFTPELVTAVWVGTDQQKPKAVGEVGGRVAGPIFLYYMQGALKDKPIEEFSVPPEAELVEGGAVGLCYRAGTVGSGLSETVASANAEDEFLREDFEEGEELELAGEDGYAESPVFSQAQSPARQSGGRMTTFNYRNRSTVDFGPDYSRPVNTRPTPAPPAQTQFRDRREAEQPAASAENGSRSGRLPLYGPSPAPSGGPGQNTYGDNAARPQASAPEPDDYYRSYDDLPEGEVLGGGGD